MAQTDWIEVKKIIENRAPNIISQFIASKEVFLPSKHILNPFDATSSNFSAKNLKKTKPGQWIPVYSIKDIPEYFQAHKMVPVRAGAAEFFFYKGTVFFNLESINFKKINTKKIKPIEGYIPTTLKAKFQRNENAYLNKAIALGYINHFIDDSSFSILKREIVTNRHKRLLYGQFGKIKLSSPLHFKTTKGNKTINSGFQFEIDLVLENQDEIIIFEAKTGKKPFRNFSLLQLYYPLIYLRSVVKEQKPIRTIFIDIVTIDSIEIYRLIEIKFYNDMFDNVQNISASTYKTAPSIVL